MKSNLENNFKDAFDTYELPYNANAWNALNDKLNQLDATKTVKPSGKNSLKWISGGAAVVITSSALLYALLKDDAVSNSVNSNAVANNTEQIVENTENVIPTPKEEKTTSSEEKSVATSDVSPMTEDFPFPMTEESRISISKQTEKTTEIAPVADKNKSGQNTPPQLPNDNKIGITKGNEDISKGSDNDLPILLLDLKNVCEGEVLPIENKNPFAIILVSPTGKDTEIPAGKMVEYSISESGTYTVIYSRDVKRIEVFRAHNTPKIDFIINEGTQYEDGLPSIALETYSEGSNFEWSFEGIARKQYGDKVNARFYKKGTKEITLTSTHSSGCKSTITKTVTIEKDYKLLAQEVFSPTNDGRFIPKALTVRNTNFKMQIIEPRTGTVIFETTSVEGWDGTDRITQGMSEENKSYAWKVILANPEPDEKKQYDGIVIRTR